MVRPVPETSGNTTRATIVTLLKAEGALDAAQMAQRLGLTAMGVRQHLYELQREKLVQAEERPVPLGRPAKYWSLTREADRLFPDAHAELNVALLAALQKDYGERGLKRVLESRRDKQQLQYARRIGPSLSVRERAQELAKIRTEEGYMAEVRQAEDGNFLLLENHCPIWAAASACQGFCASELQLFQAILGPETRVERTEHIVSGDRRCAYRITARSPSGSKTPRPDSEEHFPKP